MPAYSLISLAGVALLVLLLAGATAWWLYRRAQRWQPPMRFTRADLLSGMGLSSQQASTVSPDPRDLPMATLALSSVERLAFGILREAFPQALLLAHVPLGRFVRLPARERRGRWLQGVGLLDADLLLCDQRFRVLAVVDVRLREESVRSNQRNERLARVLKAAGVMVHVWREGSLPTAQQARDSMAPALKGGQMSPAHTAQQAAQDQHRSVKPTPAFADSNHTQPPPASEPPASDFGPSEPPAAARHARRAGSTG